MTLTATATANRTGIAALRANVSEAEALRSFSASNPATVLWRLRIGPCRRIAAAYVPFRLYRLRYEMSRKIHTRYFALDQVQGMLDLFEFPAGLKTQDLDRVQTRNQIPATLDPEKAEDLLRDKVLRLLFQQGFFRMNRPNLEIEGNPIPFSIPYWLGFYGKDGSVRCRVLDAVRRRMEGPKAALLFEQWLAG